VPPSHQILATPLAVSEAAGAREPQRAIHQAQANICTRDNRNLENF